MIYSTHVSAESCSLWEVFGSRPKLKCTNTTTKNDNLYRSTYIVYLEVI